MNDWTLAAICALLITSVLIIIALGLGLLIKTGLMVGLVVLSVLGVGLTLSLKSARKTGSIMKPLRLKGPHHDPHSRFYHQDRDLHPRYCSRLLLYWQGCEQPYEARS